VAVTANGYEALASNATGIGNTANGVFALDANPESGEDEWRKRSKKS
jgi:hypothetical protein